MTRLTERGLGAEPVLRRLRGVTVSVLVAISPASASPGQDPKTDEARLHFKIAQVALDQDDLDRALAEFEKVVELVPGNAVAQYNLAVLYEKKGWRVDAVDRLARARKLGLPETERDGALALDARLEYAKGSESPQKVAARLVGVWEANSSKSGTYSTGGQPYTSETRGRLSITNGGGLRAAFEGDTVFNDKLGPGGGERVWKRLWRAQLSMAVENSGALGGATETSLAVTVDSAEQRQGEGEWEPFPEAGANAGLQGNRLSFGFYKKGERWLQSYVFLAPGRANQDDPFALSEMLGQRMLAEDWAEARPLAERLLRTTTFNPEVMKQLHDLASNDPGTMNIYRRWFHHAQEIVRDSPSQEAVSSSARGIDSLCGKRFPPMVGGFSREECLNAFDIARGRRDDGSFDVDLLESLRLTMTTHLFASRRFKDYVETYPTTPDAIQANARTTGQVLEEVMDRGPAALVAQMALGNRDQAEKLATWAERVFSGSRFADGASFAARARRLGASAGLAGDAVDTLLKQAGISR